MTTTTNDYDLIVLGAGVVGVNTAYWALEAGKSVCVIDRQPAAGVETSFANGGQISVSHAEPWANPGAPLKILKWLADDRAPLLFRPQPDVRQWKWILSFLLECLPSRADRNTARIVALALDSRKTLQEIRRREGITYDERQKGILHFYSDQEEFSAASRAALLMQRYGCDRRIVDRDEVLAIEPAFQASRDQIVGATFTPEDESGDALKYTQRLADICRTRGADMQLSAEVVALHRSLSGSSITSVEVRTPNGYRTFSGRDVVICMGSYSAPFLARYGVALNIYPTKGYSITVPIEDPHKCPTVSLTDDEHKLVYSNLYDRLRVAGTAELAGFDLGLNDVRCQAIVDRARALFPQAANYEAARFWTGLRPATPSNLPYIGRTGRYDNLWLNTGHGTLGWTLGAGSGHRIVEMIGQRGAEIVA